MPNRKMTGYHSPPHFLLDCSLHFLYHLSYTSIEILGYKLRLRHQLTSCTSGHIFNQHVLRSSQICSHTMEAQKKIWASTLLPRSPGDSRGFILVHPCRFLRVIFKNKCSPQKLNIDTQNGHIYKRSHLFPNHHRGYPYYWFSRV